MIHKKQKIFIINTAKGNRELGIIHFYESSVIEENEYSVKAILSIDVKFTSITGDQYNSNFFHASYVARKLNNIITESQASISSSNPHAKGAIFVDPERIRGNRVGSLVMSHIVKWLRQFDGETVIKEIEFSPDNYDIAKKFYTNFGIPICGNNIKIKDLIDKENWKKNILELPVQDFARLQWQRQKEIELAEIEIAEIDKYKNTNQNDFDLYSYRSIFFGLPSLENKFDSTELSLDLHEFNSYYTEFYLNSSKENLSKLIKQYAEISFKHEDKLNKLKQKKDNFKRNNLDRVRRIKFDYLIVNIKRFLFKNIIYFLVIFLLLITYLINK